ncbi:MAG: transcriptional regulator [Candidatus Vecturithrix sp.]|jgi:predicted transcriptional regulator|nr:transcriptional regulator [Candidatus Vecturithrix sp.]
MNGKNKHGIIRDEALVRVGIISGQDYQKRTIAIAKGEYIPKPDEPKIWFESLETLTKVFSSKNQELLKVILERNPDSLGELEQVTGRSRSNLSKILRTMERYGIVDLEQHNGSLKPIVKATDFQVEFGIHQAL